MNLPKMEQFTTRKEIKMSKDITYKEYHDEIESIVRNCFDAETYNDIDEDTWTDRLHEQIDGHQWVIYTGYHTDVLKLSDNDDYCFDQGLIDASSAKSLSDITIIAAFWAMYADCLDWFSSNRDEVVQD